MVASSKFHREFAAGCGRLLEMKGFTRSELARESGIHRGTLSRLLDCQGGVTLDSAAKIAGAFGVDIDDVRRLGGAR